MSIYSDKLAYVQVVTNSRFLLHKCAPEKNTLPPFKARLLRWRHESKLAHNRMFLAVRYSDYDSIIFLSRNDVSTGVEATESMTSSSVYQKAPNRSPPSVYQKAPDTPPAVELQQRWNSSSKDLWGTVVKGETFKVILTCFGSVAACNE